MDGMKELSPIETLEFERRADWYQVNALLLGMGQAAARLHLRPKDI